MSTKIKTFRDLRDFLNTLNYQQLDQTAYLQRVDCMGERIESGSISDEPEYLTDEGWAPVSTFEPDGEYDKIENYDQRPAGIAYLWNE